MNLYVIRWDLRLTNVLGPMLTRVFMINFDHPETFSPMSQSTQSHHSIDHWIRLRFQFIIHCGCGYSTFPAKRGE